MTRRDIQPLKLDFCSDPFVAHYAAMSKRTARSRALAESDDDDEEDEVFRAPKKVHSSSLARTTLTWFLLCQVNLAFDKDDDDDDDDMGAALSVKAEGGDDEVLESSQLLDDINVS